MRPRILSIWRQRVVDVLPQADELTRQQLDNSIPRLLQQLADAMEAPYPRQPAHDRRRARAR